MINKPGFLYAPPMLGHAVFEARGETALGQAPPAAAPQTIVVQAPAPAVAAPAPAAPLSDGVSLLGILIVGGALLVGLEVGGVINIFGLNKLQEKLSSKHAQKA